MTDTNRLARANQFRLNYQPRHSAGDARTNAMLADFAASEVKAAVEWTPVSERLPEKEDGYLVSHFFGSEEMVSESYWNITQNRFEDPSENYKSMPDVIAWMPLPEPYQPKEEQDAAKMS